MSAFDAPRRAQAFRSARGRRRRRLAGLEQSPFVQLFVDPADAFREVVAVDLDADEIDVQPRGGHGRAPEPEEGIHRRPRAFPAVQPHAVFGQPRRERGGVRAVLVAALDGVVGNEPGVAAAAPVGAARAPPGDVRRVLVLDADAAAIERRPPRGREVEDELVAVVQEARAVDRLVVADGQVALQAGARGRPRPCRWRST